MIKKIFSTLIESSNDRMKNPLIASFMTSFIILNWKPIFILLFSTETIEYRVDIIEECYSSSKINILIPLGLSLFYVTIFPYIMWVLDIIPGLAINGRKKYFVNQKILEIQGKQRITEQEVILEDLKANYKDKSNLNNTIETLKAKLESKNKEISELNNEISSYSEKINIDNILTEKEKEKYEIEYLDFTQNNVFKYFRELGTEVSVNNSIPKRLTEIIIEKFIYSDIIYKEEDFSRNKVSYHFTKRGKYFWSKFVKDIEVSDDEAYELFT